MDIASAEEVAHLLRESGARIGADTAKPWRDTRDQVLERALEIQNRLRKIRARVLFRDDPLFPKQLLDLRDPPHWLFVQGEAETLATPSVAVVGTREPTSDGVWLARNVGYHLRDWQVPTVSGLAVGIDQEIHMASLRAKVPTIAFLGTGIFSDYPKNSESLRAKIVQDGGAIVTEYLPNESYSAKNFVKRNRLQAALANSLIPVEWSIRSGTAHTVKFAVSLGRDVAFVRVPYGSGIDWLGADVARGKPLFSLPQQEVEFSSFVTRSLQKATMRADRQLSLF